MRELILGLLVLVAFAQTTTAQDARQDKYNVMIVPFDPDMYFSDSDEMLARYNQKSIPEVRKMFRYGMSMNLSAKLVGEYGTRSMLNDTMPDLADDLYMIYKNISYHQAKSAGPLTLTPDEQPEEKQTFGGRMFNRNTTDKGQGTASNTTTTAKHEAKNYIATKVHDVAMLQYLHEKYGTEVFVFISQFNLVTNYEHCLDRERNVFERELMVHFTIYDYNGNVMAGDVASIYFPSNTNDMAKIIAENFPGLSQYILASLPADRKVAGEEEEEVNGMNNMIKNN